MRIKCDDTWRARSNLEASVMLGRQNCGLFGFIETLNINGELYVNYRSGTGFHGVTDRRKIVFEENSIVLKDDRPIIYFLIECVILFVVIAAMFLAVGEFLFSIIFAHNINCDVIMVLLSPMVIWGIKAGPMFHVKKYVKAKIENGH